MPSQTSGESNTRTDLRPETEEVVSVGREGRNNDDDDLGPSVSNKVVAITLVIGVGLLLLVLMLPYLGGL